MRPGLLLLVLSTAPALAQGLKWQLPERGGAQYTRSLKVDSKVEPEGAFTPDVWRGAPAAAIVLDGEFDDAHVRRAGPVWDVRELVAQLGFDLGTPRAGKGQLEIAHGGMFQPVRVEASFGALGDDGRQTFTATIEFDAKAARADGAPAPHAPRLTGRVQGSRTIDRGNGIVTRIEGSTDLTFEFPPHKEDDRALPARRQTVHVTDVWSDPVVMSTESPEWKTRVANAIRSSIANLRGQVEAHANQPVEPTDNPYHDIQPGELALMLLALRHGGEDGRDPLLQSGYESLRKRVIAGTYSLAVAMLAVEALYTPPGEWELLRTGRLKAPMARELPAADLELVRGWATNLLDNIDTTVDSAYVRRWHYGPSKDYDNSNTQYALLGLYAAQLCGVEISPQVWTAAGNHWLMCATSTGAATVPEILLQKDLSKGSRTRSGYSRTQPRGWGYQAGTPTGSMTAAGITGLTLCNAGLRQQRKGNPKLLTDMEDAVRGGFLWLQHELSVRHNLGPPGVWDSWHLYYLYGLERACELNQVARLGGRDWYFEGSLQLIATQGADGGWGSLPDTAFGLLFLKKAALPAITGH